MGAGGQGREANNEMQTSLMTRKTASDAEARGDGGGVDERRQRRSLIRQLCRGRQKGCAHRSSTKAILLEAARDTERMGATATPLKAAAAPKSDSRRKEVFMVTARPRGGTHAQHTPAHAASHRAH